MSDVKRMTLRLPIDTWHRLRDEAHQTHKPITELVLDAIEQRERRRILRDMAQNGQRTGLHDK